MDDAQELIWLWLGVASYVAGLLVILGRRYKQNAERITMWLVGVGVMLLTVAISIRWQGVGHGPFLSMYEILLSNLFSLGLISSVVCWRVRLARKSLLGVTSVLTLLGVWAIVESPAPTILPPTYDNYWLWIHVTFGKIFLGICLVSVGLAIACLLNKNRWLGMSQPSKLLQTDALVWRFLSTAFVFHSLMLIAGAVWAQDAWGRFWNWDPLETWAFVTWLSIAILLHIRITYRIPSWLGWMGVVGVFVFAFFTFFGMPFISLAPHKGAV